MADGGESACAVCGQHTGKARVHYGGLSCYSCRAFFRRNTQRDELPLCKAENQCVITKLVRKQCAACRYAKCIRIGMKPELVLDDEEKRTRFRKHLSKKDGEHEHDGSQVDTSERNHSNSPPYELETSTTPSSIQDAHDRLSFNSPHPESLLHTSNSSSPHGSMLYNQRSSPPQSLNPAITKATQAKPTSYLFEPTVTEIKTEVNIGQNSSLPYTHNSSMAMPSFENTNYDYLLKKHSFPSYHNDQTPYQIYPEKPQQNPVLNTHGENYRNWSQFPQYLKTNNASNQNMFYGSQSNFKTHHYSQSPVKSLDVSSKKEGTFFYPFNTQTYSDTNAKSVITNNTKDESLKLISQSIISDLNQFPNSSEIPSTSSKTYQSILKPKEEVDYDSIRYNQTQCYRHDEDIIQRYVQHSKDLNPYNEKSFENYSEPTMRVQDQGKRKSVIVRAGTANRTDDTKELEKFNEGNMTDIINQTLSLIPDAGDMLKNFNFDLMQDLYTNEEQNHVGRIVTLWQEKWDEINFGQNIVDQYIRFCQYRTEFPAEFFKMVNLQIRERSLNFVCSLKEIEQISAEEQIFLFRRNIENAEMLSYVHSFNQNTWTEELDFVLGKNDKIQWRDRDSSISGLPLSSIVCNMPLSEVDKLELYKNLMSCTVTVLADRTVFILMCLIIIFSQDEGNQLVGVMKVQNNFVTMLMRYLLQKRGTDIDTDMNMVYSCIAALPRIGRSFTKIKEAIIC